MKKIILISLFGLVFSQTELTTRLYEYSLDMSLGDTFDFNLTEITGYDIDRAIVDVIGFEDYSFFESSRVDWLCDNLEGAE